MIISSPGRGQIATKQGRYRESILYFDKAIESFAKFGYASITGIGVIWFSKGFSLFNLKMYNESANNFAKAIELDPKNSAFWFGRAVALAALKKYNEAIMCYDRILELEPNNVTYWIKKGRALDTLKGYKEAIECYDKVLTINPDDVTALVNRGLALGLLGHYLEAINCFDKVLLMNPNNIDALRHKERCLSEFRKINQSNIFSTVSSKTTSEEPVKYTSDGKPIYS